MSWVTGWPKTTSGSTFLKEKFCVSFSLGKWYRYVKQSSIRRAQLRKSYRRISEPGPRSKSEEHPAQEDRSVDRSIAPWATLHDQKYGQREQTMEQ